MKEDAKITALKKNALFSSLTFKELLEISGKIVFKNFAKNELILREEQSNAFMYIIMDGAAKVIQTTEEGKEIILTVHKSGDFFGELSLIDGKTAHATVCATKNSSLAIISKKVFFDLLQAQQKVFDNLLEILCARLRESMKKITILNFNNSSQRIKMLFLLLAESHGEKTSEGTTLDIKLIHQDIAAMTGLTRETVTRVLDKWVRGGEIRILKNKFIFLKTEFESISL